jgi:hypothetical protein
MKCFECGVKRQTTKVSLTFGKHPRQPSYVCDICIDCLISASNELDKLLYQEDKKNKEEKQITKPWWQWW